MLGIKNSAVKHRFRGSKRLSVLKAFTFERRPSLKALETPCLRDKNVLISYPFPHLFFSRFDILYFLGFQ